MKGKHTLCRAVLSAVTSAQCRGWWSSSCLTSFVPSWFIPQVPYDDLRYLFGEIMYGGHITDDWDRRLCKTYLEEFIKPEMLEGELLLAPGFPLPGNMDYNGYHQVSCLFSGIIYTHKHNVFRNCPKICLRRQCESCGVSKHLLLFPIMFCFCRCSSIPLDEPRLMVICYFIMGSFCSCMNRTTGLVLET